MDFRPINIEKDKGVLLEFHCLINYKSDSPHGRKVSFDKYKEKWFKTTQPISYLSNLSESTKDDRTIAEIVEENGLTIGYFWVVFREIADYKITIAEIKDVFVIRDYQKKGLGTKIMRYIEKNAKKKGATVIRSGAGYENRASLKLHKNLGFIPYLIEFEKII